MDNELKLCPFCGSNNLGFSDKTTTVDYKRKRHVAIYCKVCNCYGARTLLEEIGFANREGKEQAYEIAKNAWNKRL